MRERGRATATESARGSRLRLPQVRIGRDEPVLADAQGRAVAEARRLVGVGFGGVGAGIFGAGAGAGAGFGGVDAGFFGAGSGAGAAFGGVGVGVGLVGAGGAGFVAFAMVSSWPGARK